MCNKQAAARLKTAADDAAKHQASLKAAARARELERKVRASTRARLEHAERSRLAAIAKLLSKFVASAAVASVLKRALAMACASSGACARENAARLAAVLAANAANVKAKERTRAVEARRRAQATSSDVPTSEGTIQRRRRRERAEAAQASVEQRTTN
jgi:hypothetical protein